MKLIDKDALVTEINQRVEDYKSHKIDDSYHDGLIFALEDLRDDFINTLELKEVDLEKKIKEIQRKYKTIDEYEDYPSHIYSNDIEWIAKHFFELGLKAQKGEEYDRQRKKRKLNLY